MKRLFSLFLFLCLSACTSMPSYWSGSLPWETSSPVIRITEEHTDMLMLQSKNRLAYTAPILVSNLVELQDFDRTSLLGMSIAEIVAGKLNKLGYTVVEPKLKSDLSMSATQGELMLSRESQHLARQIKAQAVLVGHYVVEATRIVVTLKLVQIQDNLVLASSHYVLDKDANTLALLRH